MAAAVCFCMPHIFPAAEYHGMSGSAVKNFLEVFIMCNNGFFGGNCCWIIILLILFCGCGNNGMCGTNFSNNCGCDNNCGCC